MTDQPCNLLFLGPPGAGKGTVAELLCDRLQIVHLSTGDMFRAAIRAGTELGKRVQSIMSEGSLVPDDVTVGLVRERLAEDDVRNGYILDGFPRTIPQAEALERFGDVTVAINMIVDEELVVRRLSGRRVCSNCGEIYHVENHPPKVDGVCDVCGGTPVQRDDDQPASIRHRLEVYEQETAPLIGFYRQRGLLGDVDGSEDAEAVCDHILEILEKLKIPIAR